MAVPGIFLCQNLTPKGAALNMDLQFAIASGVLDGSLPDRPSTITMPETR